MLSKRFNWCCIVWALLAAPLSISEAKGEVVVNAENMDSVNSISLTADGRQAITGTPQSVAILWDTTKGVRSRVLSGHNGAVVAVDFGADGKRAVTGSYDQTAILWDADTGANLRSFSGHTGWVVAVKLSDDGKRAVTGSMDKTAILWEVTTGKKLRTFVGHEVLGVSRTV